MKKESKIIRIPENDACAREWADTLGRFFQGMGWIETVTMEFIAGITEGFKFKSMKKKFLSQKLTYIIENLGEHSDATGETLEAIHEALEEARQLSFFRNVLANGAMGLSGAESGESDEDRKPVVIGILNYRPEDTDQDAEIVSLEEVKVRTEEANQLAGKLTDQYNGLTFSPLKAGSAEEGR